MKIFLAIIAIMALVLGSFAVFGVPTATPVVTTGTASVGVNEVISFTVLDLGTSGIGFGNFNPGTLNNTADPNPALDLIVGSVTNVDVTVSLKGTAWSGPVLMTLASTSVRFDDDVTLSESPETAQFEGVLTTSYQNWYTVPALLGNPANTTSVFHWVSIPADQKAGDYTSTFTYRLQSQ